MTTAPELAPTETDLVLANGNPPRLTRYDPAAAEPDYLFEVLNNHIVRKTVGAAEVRLANRLHRRLDTHVVAAGIGECHIELGYALPNGTARRKPDVSFLSYARWARDLPFPDGDFVPVAPDLAVEVISPHELARVSVTKVHDYFRGGVRAVWVIYPHVGQVYCYESPTTVRVVGLGDDLTGDPVVPGFRLPLAELFPATQPASAASAVSAEPAQPE